MKVLPCGRKKGSTDYIERTMGPKSCLKIKNFVPKNETVPDPFLWGGNMIGTRVIPFVVLDICYFRIKILGVL